MDDRSVDLVEDGGFGGELVFELGAGLVDQMNGLRECIALGENCEYRTPGKAVQKQECRCGDKSFA